MLNLPNDTVFWRIQFLQLGLGQFLGVADVTTHNMGGDVSNSYQERPWVRG